MFQSVILIYKMNCLTILFAFFAPCYVVFGQQGPCEIALSGDRGECKSIFKCQPLLSVVNKADKTLQDKSLLKRSHCGIDDDAPAVCCLVQNEPQQCFTPEGKPGQCTSLYSCPNLLNLLTPPGSDDRLRFVQNSKCKGTDQYSVCCGPVPNFDSVMKGNCNLTAFPPDPRTECCGVDSIIINSSYGGTAATIYQYPWLAVLEYNKNGKKNLLGSGALISGKYVVTSATAVTNSNTFGELVNTVLGEYDTSIEGPDCVEIEGVGKDCSDGAIRIPVETTIPHPEYNAKESINDISLIRLKKSAPFTDFIRPICLPTVDVTRRIDPFNMTAAGWGATSSENIKSNIKRHVNLPYVSRDQCQSAYSSPGRTVMIRKTYLCAGGEEDKNSCISDGALMYKNGWIYEYVGIVNFGAVPCGQKGIPTVYTNVYDYIFWIRNTIVP